MAFFFDRRLHQARFLVVFHRARVQWHRQAVFDRIWGILPRFTPVFCRLKRPNQLISCKTWHSRHRKRPQTSASVRKCPYFRGTRLDSQRFSLRWPRRARARCLLPSPKRSIGFAQAGRVPCWPGLTLNPIHDVKEQYVPAPKARHIHAPKAY